MSFGKESHGPRPAVSTVSGSVEGADDRAAPARRLGLDSALALLAGQVIGIGIFLTPAGMVRSLGSPPLMLGVWLITGGAALCGALCFAELASRLPGAGGPYLYLREAWGDLPAFLYGWKCLIVMDPGLTAALAAGFAAQVAVLTPMPAPALRAVAMGVVILLAGANMAGTLLAAGVVRWLTLLKIWLLMVLVVLGFASGAGSWGRLLPEAAELPAGAGALATGLAAALVSAFFSFGGWWEVSKIAGEVRDPGRTLPRAFAIGIGAVTLLYILASAMFVYLVPASEIGAPETFAAQAGAVLFGAGGARLLAALVALCVLGTLAAVMTLCPRVYVALARDGGFIASVGEVNPATGAPTRAVAVQAVLACILIMVGTFEQIVAWFIFATVAFLGLTVAGLASLRRRGGPTPFAAPLHPLPALIFLAYVVLVLALLAAGSPKQALLGTVAVAAGVPVYHMLRRHR